MLIYSQSSGKLSIWQGGVLGIGYSGKGEGRNNPDAQGRKGIGPIPRGFWRIGAAYQSARTGPCTIPLYKLDGEPGDDIDDATGRSAFRIHGDNARNDASEGCIIVGRVTREAVDISNHEILMVTK